MLFSCVGQVGTVSRLVGLPAAALLLTFPTASPGGRAVSAYNGQSTPTAPLLLDREVHCPVYSAVPAK